MTETKPDGAMMAEIKRMREIAQNTEASANILATLGEMAEVADAIGSTYSKGMIYLSPAFGYTARQVALIVIARLKALGCPPVKAEKKFEEDSGTITFSIPAFDGWTVEVKGGDPRCKVKKITERIAVPARTVVSERYVIENPDECGAEIKE